MKAISIVDYGLGNLLSVRRAFDHVGCRSVLVDTPEAILQAESIVLPGVGAFPDGMEKLKSKGFDQAIVESSKKGTPLLGICLGMQFLMECSDEFAETQGLGLIEGNVSKINPGKSHKIPHIGWNNLENPRCTSWSNSAFDRVPENTAMYFVHSFSVRPKNHQDILATVSYGNEKIIAAVAKDNVIGCQFHPEKSGEAGLQIIRQFSEME